MHDEQGGEAQEDVETLLQNIISRNIEKIYLCTLSVMLDVQAADSIDAASLPVVPYLSLFDELTSFATAPDDKAEPQEGKVEPQNTKYKPQPK